MISNGSAYNRLPAPAAPIEVALGRAAGVLSFVRVTPAPGDFFLPRTLSRRPTRPAGGA